MPENSRPLPVLLKTLPRSASHLPCRPKSLVACLQSFGDYELLSELGPRRHGRSSIRRGSRQSGRLIALKMMLGEKADLGRFIIEARAAASCPTRALSPFIPGANMTAIPSLRWIMFPAKPLASFGTWSFAMRSGGPLHDWHVAGRGSGSRPGHSSIAISNPVTSSST